MLYDSCVQSHVLLPFSNCSHMYICLPPKEMSDTDRYRVIY